MKYTRPFIPRDRAQLFITNLDLRRQSVASVAADVYKFWGVDVPGSARRSAAAMASWIGKHIREGF